MNKYMIYSLMLAMAFFTTGCSDDDDTTTGKGEEAIEVVQPTKTNKMNVYIHYMPWFETPETNGGKWGSHWTMNTCDPNIVDANGRRQIASHYYPITGPYASTDEAILDYQCLLMKYAGADGLMIDWYGTQNANDYPANKRNTEAIVKALTRAGLKFSIVYEDATLAHASDMVTQARLDMSYLAENFFRMDNYVKVKDNRPLLLAFGPQQMKSPKDWFRTFSILYTQPMFISLNGHSAGANNEDYQMSQGEFAWVNDKPNYAIANRYEMYIAGAMPGFHDYYKEGGAGEGYPTYPHEDGALFQRQLDAAKAANLQWLQISTWNDYGEGTTIEPTEEYGYKYLTALQKFTGVQYSQSDLELIYRWYKVRMAKPNDTRVAEAYKYLATLQTDKAASIISSLE